MLNNHQVRGKNEHLVLTHDPSSAASLNRAASTCMQSDNDVHMLVGAVLFGRSIVPCYRCDVNVYMTPTIKN